MTKLKFRAYKYSPARGHYVEYSDQVGGLASFFAENEGGKVVQYIGREDANGVEIYEGDCFDDDGVVFVQYCEKEAKYVAAWQGMKEYDTPVNMSAYVKSDIEIFGNIHQGKVEGNHL